MLQSQVLNRPACKLPTGHRQLAPAPKSDIEPQSTQRIGEYGAESRPSPTLCSLCPLWLILYRFLGPRVSLTPAALRLFSCRMGTPAPAPILDLVDRFDQDRKVFVSPDYKEEQLRAEFLNGPCPTIRHSDFAVWTCLEGFCLVARRSDFGVWTFLDPFFTALGWDMDNAIDTIRTRTWECPSLFQSASVRNGNEQSCKE